MPIQSLSEDAGSTVRLNDFNSAVLQPRLLRKHIARSRLYVIEQINDAIDNSSTDERTIVTKKETPDLMLEDEQTLSSAGTSASLSSRLLNIKDIEL